MQAKRSAGYAYVIIGYLWVNCVFMGIVPVS